MTEMLLSAAIGYGIGQLSPAALISKLKNKDLRENGTGNLGATNTMLVFGKAYGIAVMIFDVLKAYVAIIIMVVTDTGYYGPVSAMILFPAWLFLNVKSLIVFGSVAAVGGLIIYKHRENFMNAKEGKEIRVREFNAKCEELQSEENECFEEVLKSE